MPILPVHRRLRPSSLNSPREEALVVAYVAVLQGVSSTDCYIQITTVVIQLECANHSELTLNTYYFCASLPELTGYFNKFQVLLIQIIRWGTTLRVTGL